MVEKQTMPTLKAQIVGILNPEDQGRCSVIGVPSPLFVKNVLFRISGHGKLLIMPRLCPLGILLSTIRGLK